MNPTQHGIASSIIVVAVEGGIGYWSVLHDYLWYSDILGEGSMEPGPGGGDNALAVIQTLEDLDAGGLTLYDIHPKMVWEGVEKIANGEVKASDWIKDLCAKLLKATSTDDIPSNLDSWAADAIVQVAALGEIVYG